MVKGDPGSVPRLAKISWREGMLPTPVLFPGEFYGQRSLWVTVYRVSNRYNLETNTHFFFFFFTI